MCIGGEDRVDVGLTESFVVHAPEEEVDGRGVGDIRGRCSASTTSEEAPDASKAVDNDRTRVASLREGARLIVERKNRPFFRDLRFAIKGVPGVAKYIVRTADG